MLNTSYYLERVLLQGIIQYLTGQDWSLEGQSWYSHRPILCEGRDSGLGLEKNLYLLLIEWSEFFKKRGVIFRLYHDNVKQFKF